MLSIIEANTQEIRQHGVCSRNACGLRACAHALDLWELPHTAAAEGAAVLFNPGQRGVQAAERPRVETGADLPRVDEAAVPVVVTEEQRAEPDAGALGSAQQQRAVPDGPGRLLLGIRLQGRVRGDDLRPRGIRLPGPCPLRRARASGRRRSMREGAEQEELQQDALMAVRECDLVEQRVLPAPHKAQKCAVCSAAQSTTASGRLATNQR
jgi:hypothetical protein